MFPVNQSIDMFINTDAGNDENKRVTNPLFPGHYKISIAVSQNSAVHRNFPPKYHTL